MSSSNDPQQQPKAQPSEKVGPFAILKAIPALIFAFIMLSLIASVAVKFFDLFTSPTKSVLELPGK